MVYTFKKILPGVTFKKLPKTIFIHIFNIVINKQGQNNKQPIHYSFSLLFFQTLPLLQNAFCAFLL